MDIRDGHADIFADAHRCGYSHYPTYVGYNAIYAAHGMASASTWPSLVKIDHVISKSVNEIFPKKDCIVDFQAP